MHPSIKFTWIYSKDTVNFLDLTTFKPRGFEGRLAFKPYSKPTSKTPVHTNGISPSHLYQTWLCIMRRCSKPKYFKSCCNWNYNLRQGATPTTSLTDPWLRSFLLHLLSEQNALHLLKPRVNYFLKPSLTATPPPLQTITSGQLGGSLRWCKDQEQAEVYMCLKNVANIRRLITRSALKDVVRFGQPLPEIYTHLYRIARVASNCGWTGYLTGEKLHHLSCHSQAFLYCH